MNRRSFFNKCALFVAGCAFAVGSVASALARAEAEKNSHTLHNLDTNHKKVVPNPDYCNAPYEVAFLLDKNVFDCGLQPISFKRGGCTEFEIKNRENYIKQYYPIRFDDKQNYISPYKEIPNN